MKFLKFLKTLILSLSLLTTTATANEIKIGLLLPFSGVYAGLGTDIENGFRLGLTTFANQQNPQIIKADSEAKPAIALAKTKKMLFQDKIDVMTGIVSSAVLGALRDTVHNNKTPLVVANAGNIHATGEECSAYITRISFSNAQISRPMGDWMAKNNIRKAYVMAPDYAAGHQMIDAFRETFEAGGGQIVGEAYPPLSGTKDYGSYLAVAKASDAEALFVFFAGGAAINFVKQYKEFAIDKSLPLYAAGFLTSPAYVQVQGEAADGIIASLHYLPSLPNAENLAFKSAYESRYNKPVSEFAVAGYDAARLITRAWDESNGDKKIFAEKLRQISFAAPRGQLSIDPKTNNVVQNIYIFKNRFDGNKVIQETLHTYENRRDPVGGCQL